MAALNELNEDDLKELKIIEYNGLYESLCLGDFKFSDDRIQDLAEHIEKSFEEFEAEMEERGIDVLEPVDYM